ncbi:hypothetical protein F5879DRAFT_435950 [Lentinula edodes]|nr:hypothetical protein F5879DRAFT_435950 [Lentinula edodes]
MRSLCGFFFRYSFLEAGLADCRIPEYMYIAHIPSRNIRIFAGCAVLVDTKLGFLLNGGLAWRELEFTALGEIISSKNARDHDANKSKSVGKFTPMFAPAFQTRLRAMNLVVP